ncbi:RagB/SusD family nutrient uptake outer membrane protein [Marinilabiliaceae bacterium JC017]|nr:RagB/SusD family nutrient uptake outer membrane protein [Marinilabiliaceae bacterium JC017]
MYIEKMKYYLTIMVVSLFLGGCESDLLDVDLDSVIDNEEIEKNPEMAENLFLSSYKDLQNQLNRLDQMAPNYSGWNAYCDEGMDNAPLWDGANAFTKPGGRGYGDVFSNNAKNKKFWPYKDINRLNKFISDFSKSEDKKILSTVGEAHFLRGYLYFELVKRYGGVPLISDKLENHERLVRSSEKESWDFIANELDSAINLMVVKQKDQVTDKDRANKYTAFALKSRAMLYAGTIAKYGLAPENNGLQGIEKSEAERYLTLAYAAADSVVKSQKYALYDNYHGSSKNYQYIFLDENNDEVIFQFDFDFPGNGHSYDMHWAPYRFRDGWGTETVPLLELVEDYEYTDGTIKPFDYTKKYQSVAEVFEGKDLRLDGTILHGGSKWHGEEMEVHRETRVIKSNGDEEKYYVNAEWQLSTKDNLVPELDGVHATGIDGPINVSGGWDITRTGFYIKKYLDPDKVLTSDQSWQNQILIRYGEVLLNKAEAAAELGGAYVVDGLAALNEIRSRASQPSKGELIIDEVRHERKIEMAFEMNRFWDLRRWRIGGNVLQNTMFHALNPIQWIDQTKTPAEIYYTIEKVEPGDHLKPRLYNEKDNYCPVSLSDNPGMIQNNGW